MRQESEQTEAPPIYLMSMGETLAFIGGWLLISLVVLVCLLFLPGFDNFILILYGAWNAAYYWPTIPGRVKAYRELRKFKKSIPDGMNQ